MRKRVTFTIDNDVINKLKIASEKSLIPQARLVEEAIKEYLAKMKL